jgi:hypothetical protein
LIAVFTSEQLLKRYMSMAISPHGILSSRAHMKYKDAFH